MLVLTTERAALWITSTVWTDDNKLLQESNFNCICRRARRPWFTFYI